MKKHVERFPYGRPFYTRLSGDPLRAAHLLLVGDFVAAIFAQKTAGKLDHDCRDGCRKLRGDRWRV